MRSDITSPIGDRWNLNVYMKLSFADGEIVRLTDTDGTIKYFTKGSDDFYRSPAGVTDMLLNENGIYILENQSGIRYTFIGDGRLDKITDTNSNITHIQYLVDGNVNKIVDPSGRQVIFNYSGGKLTSITGNEIPTAEYTYTGSNLTRVTIKDAGGTLLTETLYSYDAASNKLVITDALGNTTDIIYTTSSGRKVNTITKKMTIDSVLQTLTTSYSYQPNTSGMVTTVTDPMSKITEYTTNNMGNTIKVIKDKGGLNITTQSEWDEQQNLVEVTDPKGLTDADPAKYKTIMDYNEKGDITRIINPQGYNTIYDYNTKSDPTEVIDYGKKPNINNYDPNTRNLLAISDPLFSTNMMQYDAYGNVISQSNPIGIGGNMIINSGFEDWSGGLPSRWTIYSVGGTINNDINEKVNGDRSVRLQSPGNLPSQQTIILSDLIPVNESVRYNVSWYVKTLNAGPDYGGATADIHWYNQSKAWMGSQYVTTNAAPTIGTTNTFIRKGTQVSSPVNARYAKIALGVTGGPNSSPATAWFDDVQFELGSVINQYNLIYNADFELDMDTDNFPDGWSSINLTSQDILDTSVTRSGTGRSLKLMGSAALKSFSQEIQLSGTINTPIRVSGWSKAVGWSSSGGGYGVKLDFYNDTTLIGSHTFSFFGTDTNWHKNDNIVLADNTFTKLKIHVLYENQTGTAWFDDFVVRLAQAPNALMSAYNITQNGSFEYDSNQSNWPDRWIKFNSATLGTYDMTWVPTSEILEAYSGNYVMRIANVPDWAVIANTIIEPIKAGITYTASAVIKTNNVNGSGGILKFDILDNAGVYLGQKVSEVITGTRDWTRVVVTLSEAEAKAISLSAARFRVAVGTLGSSNGEMYFDAVRVLEGNLLTQSTYDTNGNYITAVRSQLGNTISMINDSRGNVTQTTDSKNNITKFTYDKLDNIKQIENPKGLISVYFYDKERNLTQIDNHQRTGPTTSVYINTTIATQYNEQILPKQITDGNWRATYFEYNKNSQLKDVKFPNGKQIHNQYDAINRLQTVNYTGDSTQWSYSYDANSNITSVVKNGEITSYDYDNLSHMTKVTFPAVFGSTDNLQYTFDPVDQPLSKQFSKLPIASQKIIYEYDQSGANMVITGPNNTSAEFMYDEESRLKKTDIRNDAMKYNTYNDYDAEGKITRLRSENKNGSPVFDYSYQYDGNGNRVKDMNNLTGKRVDYSYDSINQLIEEGYFDTLTTQTPSKRITYQFDLLGNRTQKSIIAGTTSTTTYSYNSANEVINVNGSQQYSHDYNGNMIGAYGYIFTYNAENQLVRVDLSGVEIARYEYDSRGLRNRKITPVRTERYYYDGDDLAYVTEENIATQQNKLKYFFTRDESGSLMHMIDYTATLPKTYFYILDVHGNVVALADENGNKVVNYEYDAWGNLTNTPETVTTGNGEYLSNANPFRYCSYQFDSESGLYYLKARYYTTTLGRFLTRDTLYELKFNLLSINQYRYCDNNPVNMFDPSGHLRVSVAAATIAFEAMLALFPFIVGLYGNMKAFSLAAKFNSWARKALDDLALKLSRAIYAVLNDFARSLLRHGGNAAVRSATVASIKPIVSALISLSPGYIIAKILDRFDNDGNSGYITY